MPNMSLLPGMGRVLGVLLLAALAVAGCLPGGGGGGGTAPRLPDSRPQAQAPGAPLCVVLALPVGGKVGPLADRIRVGATAAQRELTQLGIPVNVRSVDTSSADWINQVDALPEHCAVVGGPLQSPGFIQAHTRGLDQRRTLFAFIPQMDANIEGVRAWRFFPGPEDQIAALLRFAQDDLGINSYGILAPETDYGSRMITTFTAMAGKRGAQVTSASYSPTDVNQWVVAARKLVQPRPTANGLESSARFQAIFLPDSWKNMDGIVNSLLANGESRQVLLGTNLWDLGLRGMGVSNPAFQLAVYPVPWNSRREVPGLKSVPDADFWAALGYDFVRFAANLGVNAKATPAQINERVQRAQNINWAMAPMHWTPDGKASQALHLFTLTPGGPVPVDTAVFKHRREQILAAPPAAVPQSLPGGNGETAPADVVMRQQPNLPPAGQPAAMRQQVAPGAASGATPALPQQVAPGAAPGASPALTPTTPRYGRQLSAPPPRTPALAPAGTPTPTPARTPALTPAPPAAPAPVQSAPAPAVPSAPAIPTPSPVPPAPPVAR